ncbi:hypothetical protein [Paenibacillus sp. sgz5001063]
MTVNIGRKTGKRIYCAVMNDLPEPGILANGLEPECEWIGD